MLKSTDNVHPDHIRNSLFLCVRSVRQMTEQLVTIVASLNDGTNNDSYKSRQNKIQNLRNYSNIQETEKTSCEDMSSESACTRAGYNSTEVFSRNGTYSRLTNNNPQWNNLNDIIFNSSSDSNTQNSKPGSYKPCVNLSSSDAENNDFLLKAHSSTFENGEEIPQYYTTPDKFTQTLLIKPLNQKYPITQPNSISNDKDRKLDLYSTQNIQADLPIESNIIPISINGKHGKSWHGENISTKWKKGLKNSNNEDLDICPITRSKSNDQIKINRDLSLDLSEDLNLYTNKNPQRFYVYNNRDLTKTFKVYTNIPDNFNTSIEINKPLIYQEKSPDPTENQTVENCYPQSSIFRRRKTKTNTPENESVSKINIELEDLDSKLVDESEDFSQSLDYIELNKIEDLSFYETVSSICDAELSIIDKTLSKKSSEFSDIISDISMYDSQVKVPNHTNDFLYLSSVEYMESVSEITSPSPSVAEISVILSAFFEDEFHTDRMIKFDSLPSINSNNSDSDMRENEDKYFSDKVPKKKYPKKILSMKTFSQLTQTNNFKYKTINTTNCVIKNRNNIFDNCFNDPLQDESSDNELSSMKNISTLSGESVTREGEACQHNSCNITQVSIDKSESRLDLEVIIPSNMNKTNSKTVNHKDFKEVGRLDLRLRQRTVGFDKQLFSVDSNKEKRNKINNKENIIDYDDIKPTPPYVFTSCVEDCFSVSDCLTIAKKPINDNSVDLNNNDSELFEIIGVDYDTSKQHDTEITDSRQPKSFFKTYKNNSHSTSQSETVFLQPTLPTFTKFSTTSKSKSTNFHKVQTDISQKDIIKPNQLYSYENINLSIHLSCFNEELKPLETFNGISQKKTTKRKKLRHKKSKPQYIPSEFVGCQVKKRRSKNKTCPRTDSIIECFLDNF